MTVVSNKCSNGNFSGFPHNPYNGVVCNDTITATGVFSSKELWKFSKGKGKHALNLFTSKNFQYFTLQWFLTSYFSFQTPCYRGEVSPLGWGWAASSLSPRPTTAPPTPRPARTPPSSPPTTAPCPWRGATAPPPWRCPWQTTRWSGWRGWGGWARSTRRTWGGTRCLTSTTVSHPWDRHKPGLKQS